MPQPDKPASSSIAAPRADSLGAFVDFYREHYNRLIRIALAMKATLDEADDVADQTMEEVLRRWGELTDPFAYARRAVVSNLIKSWEREREGRRRMIRAFRLDPQPTDDRLNAWEDRERVLQLLESLPPAQREVLALVVDGLRPAEIAELFGKSPEAIRKSLERARRRARLVKETLDDDGGAPATPAGLPAARKEAR